MINKAVVKGKFNSDNRKGVFPVLAFDGTKKNYQVKNSVVGVKKSKKRYIKKKSSIFFLTNRLRRYFPRKILRRYKNFRLIKKFKFIVNRRHSKKNVGFLINYKNRLLSRLLFKKIFLVVYRLQSCVHFYRIFTNKRKLIWTNLGFFETLFNVIIVRLAFASKLILADFLIRSNYIFINDFSFRGNPHQLIQTRDTVFIPSLYQRVVYMFRIYNFSSYGYRNRIVKLIYKKFYFFKKIKFLRKYFRSMRLKFYRLLKKKVLKKIFFRKKKKNLKNRIFTLRNKINSCVLIKKKSDFVKFNRRCLRFRFRVLKRKRFSLGYLYIRLRRVKSNYNSYSIINMSFPVVLSFFFKVVRFGRIMFRGFQQISRKKIFTFKTIFFVQRFILGLWFCIQIKKICYNYFSVIKKYEKCTSVFIKFFYKYLFRCYRKYKVYLLSFYRYLIKSGVFIGTFGELLYIERIRNFKKKKNKILF